MAMRRLVPWALCAFMVMGAIASITPDAAAAGAVVYVDDDAAGAAIQDGSWAFPYATIQDGIDAALYGDVVEVAAGNYVEALQMQAGVKVRGAGPEHTIVASTSTTEPTVTGANGAAISFCTLRSNGLVVEASSTSLAVYDSVLEPDTTSQGVANKVQLVRCWNSSATIERNDLNSAARGGFVRMGIEGNGPLVIRDNVIRRCERAIQLSGDLAPGFRIERNLIYQNPVPMNIYFIEHGGVIANNVVESTNYNGILLAYGSDLWFVNNTVACTWRWALHLYDAVGTRVLGNNITFGYGAYQNQPDPITVGIWGWPGAEIKHNNVYGFRTLYRDIPDLTGTDGNTSVDPQYVDIRGSYQVNDFRLQATSPCIDAGWADAAGISALDLDRAPRSLDGNGDGVAVPDIGAYEYVVPNRAPEASCSVDSQVLWPPNHKVVPVQVVVTIDDDMPAASATVTCTVQSSEPDNGSGDGSHVGDVNGQDGFSAPVSVTMSYNTAMDAWIGTTNLRAERDGASEGRVYAVTCMVVDAGGLSDTASAAVRVPHDKPKKK